MGKKKGGKKKVAKDLGATHAEFVANYKKACKIIGEQPDEEVLKALNEANAESKCDKLCIGDYSMGPSGVRALADAIYGVGEEDEGSSSKTFTQLTALRLWRTRACDDGVAALARLLKERKEKLNIRALELVDNNIGIRGARYLGDALSLSGYKNITRLNLEHNPLGSEGIEAMCEGLRTNCSVRELMLGHCEIGPEGGKALSQLLSYPASKLTHLDLKCNELGSEGLRWLVVSLRRNTVLTNLNLFDNNIGGFPPDEKDVDAFRSLGNALAVNKTLTSLDMDLNYFGKEGAAALSEGIQKNTTLSEFTADFTLDSDSFNSITSHIKPSGGKKKGGKKKKKKKKKKK